MSHPATSARQQAPRRFTPRRFTSGRFTSGRFTPRLPASLHGRIATMAAAVAVITALLAGGLAIGLVQRQATAASRVSLARLADAARADADLGQNPTASQRRALRMLEALQVQTVLVTPTGRHDSGEGLGGAVTPRDLATVRAGSTLSATRRWRGARVIIEGRPTQGGGLILVQRQQDTALAGVGLTSRILAAMLAGVVVAMALGLLVARRIARPLEATARAAHALAEGGSAAPVPVEGPTEVAELGAALNTLGSSLAAARERQQDFLLNVSHDLRTPLTAIAGYSELLADGAIEAGEMRQIGATLLDESHRLSRMVTDLFDLARLGADELRIEMSGCDVTALAERTAQVWTTRCSAAGVGFRLESEPGLRVLADEQRLRQVLDSLLENALRIVPPGAPVVLAVRREGPRVLLEVRDGGPGLKPQDLDVAFERFVLHQRYRGLRKVGTGLGLAIVKGLVVRMGGEVEAGTAPEGGARFTCTFDTLPGHG